MGYVVAISATPALVNSIEDFINAVTHERKNSADKYIELVDHLTDRMLSLFLVEPGRFLDLPGGQQRVIDFAISTAGKASHMLTRQIFKKKSPAELKPIAENISEVYWPAGDDNDHQASITYPVDETFAAEFQRACEAAAAGRGQDESQTIARVMDQLSDDIIDQFFLRNSHAVKMGYVTRKALDVGTDGSRKAIQAVNHRVLKGLDNEQLARFMGHYESILRKK